MFGLLEAAWKIVIHEELREVAKWNSYRRDVNPCFRGCLDGITVSAKSALASGASASKALIDALPHEIEKLIVERHDRQFSTREVARQGTP